MRNFKFVTLSFCLFSVLIITNNAQGAWPKSDQDFTLLPPYCKARTGNVSEAEKKLWEKRLGSGFLHVHHYCAGLYTVNLSSKIRNKKERNHVLESAIKEMRYTQEHSSPKFILQPKIAYDIGKIYEQMDQPSKAMQSYYQSMKLNSKLPMPYVAISDLLYKQGDKDKAIKTLKQGLKHNPKSKILLKRLNKITKK